MKTTRLFLGFSAEPVNSSERNIRDAVMLMEGHAGFIGLFYFELKTIFIKWFSSILCG